MGIDIQTGGGPVAKLLSTAEIKLNMNNNMIYSINSYNVFVFLITFPFVRST